MVDAKLAMALCFVCSGMKNAASKRMSKPTTNVASAPGIDESNQVHTFFQTEVSEDLREFASANMQSIASRFAFS